MVGENIILWVVEDGTANTSIDNATSALTATYTYDCVIEVFENTENVASSTSAYVPIKICAMRA